MVDVKVKVFGPLRDILRKDELSVQVPSPYHGETAFEILAESHPKLHEWRASVRLAVNHEYTTFDRVLESGDEISFIPPVSGG